MLLSTPIKHQLRSFPPFRLRVLQVVGTAGLQLTQGAPTHEVLQELEDEIAALQPMVHAARRAEAEVWLEQQARTLTPRKPRKTQGWIRRNGMAQRAAARARD